MFPYNVRNTNAHLGFTLPEIIVVLVVLGALAAVGIPNFLAMLQRFQTNLTFDQVRNTIKGAQLQAIRLSKDCTITINQDARTITANDRGCLLDELNFDALTRPMPNPTSIKTNSSDGVIRFTFRGNTDSMQTIVVSSDNQNYNKCLVISNGIGMMRWGNYRGNFNDQPNPSLCENQNG